MSVMYSYTRCTYIDVCMYIYSTLLEATQSFSNALALFDRPPRDVAIANGALANPLHVMRINTINGCPFDRDIQLLQRFEPRDGEALIAMASLVHSASCSKPCLHFTVLPLNVPPVHRLSIAVPLTEACLILEQSIALGIGDFVHKHKLNMFRRCCSYQFC